jgi:exonuclease VII small subunit
VANATRTHHSSVEETAVSSWERSLQQLREELVRNIDRAQAELDNSLRTGRGTPNDGRAEKLRRQVRARAKEVREMVDDLDGTAGPTTTQT